MPRLALTVQGHGRFVGLPARSTLARWVAAALERDAEITLRFVDAREGRRLNRDFRSRDYATDVLTFAYARTSVVRADVVICPVIAWRGARESHRPQRAHLAHLVIHGVLHGQGFDHVSAKAAKAMESREVAILAGLGFGDPYLPEEANRPARK